MLVFVRAGLTEPCRLGACWRRYEDFVWCEALKVLGEAELWTSGEVVLVHSLCFGYGKHCVVTTVYKVFED